jgi:hypothetical protein
MNTYLKQTLPVALLFLMTACGALRHTRPMRDINEVLKKKPAVSQAAPLYKIHPRTINRAPHLVLFKTWEKMFGADVVMQYNFEAIKNTQRRHAIYREYARDDDSSGSIMPGEIYAWSLDIAHDGKRASYRLTEGEEPKGNKPAGMARFQVIYEEWQGDRWRMVDRQDVAAFSARELKPMLWYIEQQLGEKHALPSLVQSPKVKGPVFQTQ